MPQKNTTDIDTLARALATVLVGAMDAGYKESGGWEGFLKNGPKPYARGYKTLLGADAAVHAHGPGGIFSTPGIENVVVNAHMTPEDLDPLLPSYGTQYLSPIFPSLTGFSEDAGSEPDGKCEDCKGGTMQSCNMTATFGHVCRGSDEIHIMRTIQMINRGETTPLTLLGDILGEGGITKMPNTPTEWLEVTTKAEMVKVALLIQRAIIPMTWGGDPANNTINGGYMEFPGLDMLVGTGKMDLTGVACAALDSLVMDFGFTDVGDDVGGNDIVTYLSQMEWYIRHNAIRMGLMPVEWVICMRPELWFELTAIWSCRYLTNRCQTSNNLLPVNITPITVNDNTAIQMRDQMREGEYLIINGRRYNVRLCDGMTELQGGDPGRPHWDARVGAGNFASDIFFLPLTVRGGMKTLYWEYLDYSKADAQIALTRSGNDFWTDGGRFFWTVERLRGCYKINAEIDLRLVLRTPHLAARLDNVLYTPLEHLRSPWYGDPYFKKGGVSNRSNEWRQSQWYTEWNTPMN